MPPGAPAPLAEWWQRLLARLIDSLLLGVVAFIVSSIVGGIMVSSSSSLEAMLSAMVWSSVISGIIIGLIAFAYEFFLLGRNGQTLGKLALGIKVVQVGGALGPQGLPNDVALKRSAVLWLPLVLQGIPYIKWAAFLFVPVNILWQLFDKPLQQCLHDKVAGTVVVKVK